MTCILSPLILLLLALGEARLNAFEHVGVTKTIFNNNGVMAAFAGGGFGPSSPKKNPIKKKDKRKRGDFWLEDIPPRNHKQDDNMKEKQESPELDRFGLPVRTAENFFPPLPMETEIVGMDGDETSSLKLIREVMECHLPLNYELFDEFGIEKRDCFHDDEKPWKLRLLHKSPPVLEIENFFTLQECIDYMNLAVDQKTDQNSETQMTRTQQRQRQRQPLQVNSKTFSTLAYSKRTSTTWFCHFHQVPTFLAKTKRLLNNISVKQMEEAQIVRYRTGEEFSWHYDEIPSGQLFNGGQRIATLLVYLNTIEKGGGTIFRDLKDASGSMLTMRPKQGSALLFFPAFLDGTPDDRTLHKGEIAVEQKMIAQMWIHQHEYTPVIPEGNCHEDAMDVIHAKEVELGYS